MSDVFSFVGGLVLAALVFAAFEIVGGHIRRRREWRAKWGGR